MKITLFVCALGLALGVFSSAQVGAQEVPAPAQPVALVSGAASAFFALPGSSMPMTRLVQKARYYCRRDCEICRNDCYARFRVYCYGLECKQHFVLCMRSCWNNICRWC